MFTFAMDIKENGRLWQLDGNETAMSGEHIAIQ